MFQILYLNNAQNCFHHIIDLTIIIINLIITFKTHSQCFISGYIKEIFLDQRGFKVGGVILFDSILSSVCTNMNLIPTYF